MNETQEFGACTSIVTELRFTGMNANQSRELEGPIVAALCRHYFLEPDAVIVLGHRTVSVYNYDGTSTLVSGFLDEFFDELFGKIQNMSPEIRRISLLFLEIITDFL